MLCDGSNIGCLSSDTYWAVCYHLSLTFYPLPLSLSHIHTQRHHNLVFSSFRINKFEHTHTHAYAQNERTLFQARIFYIFHFGEPICFGCNVDLCSYGSALTMPKIDEAERENELVEKIKRTKSRGGAVCSGSPNFNTDTKTLEDIGGTYTCKLRPTFKSAQFAVNKINILH